MAHWRTRLTALAGATLLVAAVLVAVFSARFVMMRDATSDVAPVVSEIVRAGSDVPTLEPPTRREEPRVTPTPERVAPPQPGPPAPAQAEAELLIVDPIWIARPSNPERFYPRGAFMRGIEGRVELDCLVAIDGRLSCEVASENPGDQGFGEAALALARAHVMQPAMRDGAPVRGRYRMVVPFSTH